jgi:hypothetical protein
MSNAIPTVILADGTDATPRGGRFADLTVAQVLAEQAVMLARYAAEDVERRARHAAILAAFR